MRDFPIVFRNILFSMLLPFCGLSGCTSVFYHPSSELLLTPRDLQLRYEDVSIRHDDILLHGWFLPAKGKPKGTVLFLHGNAENISTHIGSVYWMPAKGFNVFIADYRGYGISGGSPDIDGIHADVLYFLSYLLQREDVDNDSIVVYGQSLGASMALFLAARSGMRNHIQAVAAESPFTSYQVIAAEKLEQLPLLSFFRRALSSTVVDDYSPYRVMFDIAPIPLLIVHGSEDEVVPQWHGNDLYNRARQPKEFWSVPGGRHNDIFVRVPERRERLLSFFESKIEEGVAARSSTVTLASPGVVLGDTSSSSGSSAGPRVRSKGAIEAAKARNERVHQSIEKAKSRHDIQVTAELEEKSAKSPAKAVRIKKPDISSSWRVPADPSEGVSLEESNDLSHTVVRKPVVVEPVLTLDPGWREKIRELSESEVYVEPRRMRMEGQGVR